MEECDSCANRSDENDSENENTTIDDVETAEILCSGRDSTSTAVVEEAVTVDESVENSEEEEDGMDSRADSTGNSECTNNQEEQAEEVTDKGVIDNEYDQIFASPDGVSSGGVNTSILDTTEATETNDMEQTQSSSPSSSSLHDTFEDDDIDRPGAHPVPRRAPGALPFFSLRLMRAAQPADSDIVASVVLEEETLPTVYPIDVRSGESIQRMRRKQILFVGVLGCALVGLVVALAITQGKVEKKGETGEISKTNVNINTTKWKSDESWTERKSLRCGVNPAFGNWVTKNEEGYYGGYFVDMCYAVGAALFGEDYRDRVIILEEGGDFRFSSLVNKEVDLVVQFWTHTMERQVYVADATAGFSFTTPYLYSGLIFGGDPFFVNCADNKNTTGDCANLRVCVTVGTTHVDVCRDLFPEENIVEVKPYHVLEKYSILKTPTCNVLAGEKQGISKVYAERFQLKDPFEVSKNIFSKEPLAMMTRHDDPQWSDFVNWVLQALFEAEKHNITQETAHEMPTTDVFGAKFKNMFINAIRAVGNYGEIYSRYLEDTIPRQGLNLINDGTSGHIYSHPFGNLLDDASSGHDKDGMLEKIFERGYLKCGVLQHSTLSGIGTEKNSPNGLGADYCYALSAGIFQDYSDETKANKTKIMTIKQSEAVTMLNKKEVDMIGLVAVNLANDVTGNMSFSQPVYHSSHEGPLALATLQDDVQWSSFVYWTAAATFYAEEQNITQISSDEMPLLNLFGPTHKMMFRKIISAVGNYGNIFDRNIDSLGPRDGLNKLNSNSGPQIYPLPGIFS